MEMTQAKDCPFRSTRCLKMFKMKTPTETHWSLCHGAEGEEEEEEEEEKREYRIHEDSFYTGSEQMQHIQK